jgi:type II secretory pathway component PulF
MAIDIKSVPDISLPKKKRQIFDLSRFDKKITLKHRILFSERLAILLETGVPLHSSLDILYRQEENPNVKRLLELIVQDVSSGESFSSAIAKHPRLFSSSYVNLIAASEKGGFMPQILEQLIAIDNKTDAMRSKLLSTMFYPAFLILFSIAVVIFVLTVIFPKFTELFESIKDQLPFTTLILMGMSDLLREHWISITGGTAFLIFMFVKWLTMSEGKEFFDRKKLTLPVIKDIFIQIYMVQIMRVMGLSLSSGVSIVDTLNSCRDIVKNSVIRNFIGKLSKNVTEGQGLSSGFKEAEFIPPMLSSMISTGEAAGNLPMVMQRVANHYEADLTKKLTNVSKLIEPFMLLIMGVLVGLIVSSLILPIFKLSRAVT